MARILPLVSRIGRGMIGRGRDVGRMARARARRARAQLEAARSPDRPWHQVSSATLFIYNANYRFLDTAVAARYRAVVVPGHTESGYVTLFESDGHRAADQSPQPVAFQKLD